MTLSVNGRSFLLGFAVSIVLAAIAAHLIYPGGIKALPKAAVEQIGPQVRPRGAGQPLPYAGDLPSLADVNIRNAALDEVHRGLDYPWAFEFVSPSTLLITEFAGDIKLLDLASGVETVVGRVPTLSKKAGTGQIGLMDVALHPDFEQNGVVYFSHAVDHDSDPDRIALGVTRGVLQAKTLRDMELILVATPHGNLPSNFGGAMVFDRAGYLYVGTGDRARRDQAQKGGMLTGKILRLTDTGEVPADNPFVGNARFDDRIFALGVRNPQGLYFDAVTESLYSTEHGPYGGDEVNVIKAGANYGWPVITYGANYTTARIGRGTAAPGLRQPLFYYLPSLAISPLTMYRGDMFPEWEGDLLVGALKAQLVSKLDLVGGVIRSDHRILGEMGGRVRDIKVAADGSLYFLVQNKGRIFRLRRDASLDAPKERDGRQIYAFACATCHQAGPGGFPRISAVDVWRERLLKGRDELKKNAVIGIGDMPAMGFCENCTEEEVSAAVDFMLDKLEQ